MDIVKSLVHPQELLALCLFKTNNILSTEQDSPPGRSENIKTCYEFLKQTSRTFCAVINRLDAEIKDAMCLYYLVLRALDTIEDDTTIAKERRLELVLSFHKFLYHEEWSLSESSGDDRIVLEKFPVIAREFRQLKKKYRDVISEICMRTGKGMAKFLDSAPETIDDWNEYCHYVAGLVGIGCTKIFLHSGLERNETRLNADLSNLMGLFLQKTNIIRDYLEDVNDDRHFWPKQIWSKYVDNLKDFSKPEYSKQALYCMNELITNALSHARDVIVYLSALNNQSIFNFCAIPQVMAIATLERCYNNLSVFQKVVKIRKGEAVYLIHEATNISNVKRIFHFYLQNIRNKIPAADPSAVETLQQVESAMQICHIEKLHKKELFSSGQSLILYGFLPILLILIFCWKIFCFN